MALALRWEVVFQYKGIEIEIQNLMDLPTNFTFSVNVYVLLFFIYIQRYIMWKAFKAGAIF